MEQPITQTTTPTSAPHSPTHTSIIKKTIAIGGSTLASRAFGIIREILTVQYLGVGAVSDAFVTAYKIPNSLRKIFADGALSAAFIPTIVKTVRTGNRDQVNSLMSLAFIFFEGIVLFLCLLTMWKTESIIALIAPGFNSEQVALAAPFLRILMPLILFLSSSALLAGALQSVGHFFVPAFSPVLLNIVFIAGLVACIFGSLPVHYLCGAIVFGSFLQLVLHLVAYQQLNFSFGSITTHAYHIFKKIFAKFFLCSMSMSIVEISLFINTSFASYLPAGSISLINYANRFMGIPLGIFATAFSTILLPHFSHVSSYAPKRLQFYLLESAKLIFWITIPTTILMIFFSEKIFHTLFLSKNFTLEHVTQAGNILISLSVALFFFSLNKILLNVYYALHNTWIPATVTAFATIINVCLNYLFVAQYQAIGLTAATSFTCLLQTLLLLAILHQHFNFSLYFKRFFAFAMRYCAQLICVFVPAYYLYLGITWYLLKLPVALSTFFLYKIGFWFWVGPFSLACLGIVYYTRKWFNIELYFLKR